MARRRRIRKPILPGFWAVAVALLLIGAIGGLFWLFGQTTEITRAPALTGPVAKKR